MSTIENSKLNLKQFYARLNKTSIRAYAKYFSASLICKKCLTVYNLYILTAPINSEYISIDVNKSQEHNHEIAPSNSKSKAAPIKDIEREQAAELVINKHGGSTHHFVNSMEGMEGPPK